MTEEAAPARAKILLVDDDTFLLDMYSAKFLERGYAVEACLSADAALGVLRGGFSPDVVVFDIAMPGRDGFSLLDALREEGLAQGAIRVALTNRSDELPREKASSFGVARYIVKASMVPSEVVAAVEEEMAKRKNRGS